MSVFLCVCLSVCRSPVGRSVGRSARCSNCRPALLTGRPESSLLITGSVREQGVFYRCGIFVVWSSRHTIITGAVS